MADTDLVLTGIGIPDYSARGLTEDLRPIDAGGNRRTVNGELVDVTSQLHRKYLLTITGSDQEAPAFDDKWEGLQVTVDTLTRLAYVTSGGSPARTVVPGSSVVNGIFTSYRLRLIMLINKFTVETDEWGAAIGWSLELEEV
jgi:hypothetical protein